MSYLVPCDEQCCLCFNSKWDTNESKYCAIYTHYSGNMLYWFGILPNIRSNKTNSIFLISLSVVFFSLFITNKHFYQKQKARGLENYDWEMYASKTCDHSLWFLFLKCYIINAANFIQNPFKIQIIEIGHC